MILGLIGLLIAWGASLWLSLERLAGMTLVGCGPGSPCAQASASVWGRVPGVNWPTSYVGLTFFSAMIVAWLVARGRLTGALRAVAVVGGVASLVLTAAMFVGGYVCVYCLVVHAGNILFVAAVVTAKGSAAPSQQDRTTPAKVKGKGKSSLVTQTNPAPGATVRSGLVPFALAAAIVTAGLFAADTVMRAQADEQAEQELKETTEKLADQSVEREPLTARWVMGPEHAPMRLVIFSDFQCKDCQRVEMEIREILAERQDLSIAAKHFPMSSRCNVHMDRDMHPNACWAARAAETAGILKGNEGFWKMHHWLFDRGGGFTDAELNAALPTLGYDVRQFTQIMMSEPTLTPVQADIEEAIALGIHYTPMIFLNGVEVRGWQAVNGVRRAVEALAATHPQPGDASQDVPMHAAEKYIADWLASPIRRLPAGAMSWPSGSSEAAVRIVMWGDLQEPNTAKADQQIRAHAAQHGDVRYEFCHYPIDQSCNPLASRTMHPFACTAASMAMAAGQLGGADAYWAMHAWLIANQVPLDDAMIARAAKEVSLDLPALQAAMNSPDIAAAIQRDAQVGKAQRLTGVPMMFINERYVPRWQLKSQPDMLDRIIDEARRQSTIAP